MTKSRNGSFPRVDGDGSGSCCQELKERSCDWASDDVSLGCCHLRVCTRFAAGGTLLSIGTFLFDI